MSPQMGSEEFSLEEQNLIFGEGTTYDVDEGLCRGSKDDGGNYTGPEMKVLYQEVLETADSKEIFDARAALRKKLTRMQAAKTLNAKECFDKSKIPLGLRAMVTNFESLIKEICQPDELVTILGQNFFNNDMAIANLLAGPDFRTIIKSELKDFGLADSSDSRLRLLSIYFQLCALKTQLLSLPKLSDMLSTETKFIELEGKLGELYKDAVNCALITSYHFPVIHDMLIKDGMNIGHEDLMGSILEFIVATDPLSIEGFLIRSLKKSIDLLMQELRMEEIRRDPSIS